MLHIKKIGAGWRGDRREDDKRAKAGGEGGQSLSRPRRKRKQASDEQKATTTLVIFILHLRPLPYLTTALRSRHAGVIEGADDPESGLK